jgi:hypothetical protein
MEGAGEAKGIDSWLSVWSNGILLENVDENRKQVTRFFPIESLHYCAAVRQVLIPERGNAHPEPKFLPLDSPFARTPRVQHPPIFAAILRRTTGIKVLECHSFICKLTPTTHTRNRSRLEAPRREVFTARSVESQHLQTATQTDGDRGPAAQPHSTAWVAIIRLMAMDMQMGTQMDTTSRTPSRTVS